MLDKPLIKELKQKLIASPRIKSFTLTLRGRSMRPFLKEGERIKFQKIGPDRLPEIGDVAAVRFRNGILVHRILRIRQLGDDREYFTKGDRRLVGDGWMPHNRIVAVVDLPVAGRILDRIIVVYSLVLLVAGKILRRGQRKK